MITNIRTGAEDRLVHEGAADPDARRRRPELGGPIGPDRQQQQGCRDRPGALRRDVSEGLAPGKVAGERERQRDRGVDVGAGEVAGRIDHDHDHEAEGQGDADPAELAAVDLVGDDRAASGEHEGEGRQRPRRWRGAPGPA